MVSLCGREPVCVNNLARIGGWFNGSGRWIEFGFGRFSSSLFQAGQASNSKSGARFRLAVRDIRNRREVFDVHAAKEGRSDGAEELGPKRDAEDAR